MLAIFKLSEGDDADEEEAEEEEDLDEEEDDGFDEDDDWDYDEDDGDEEGDWAEHWPGSSAHKIPLAFSSVNSYHQRAKNIKGRGV